ncbi:lipid A deacylase LpxR family protein [Brevundimonas sp.]|uniref:lipid A deacylase LpxR family protein n=1 Tax=Brevundimonas sp. TaxID=1871086 RepID=UPI003D0FE8DA
MKRFKRRRTGALIATLGVIGMATGAAAQDPFRPKADNGGGVALTVENDTWVPGDDTDRYYTQGMRLTGLLGPDGDGPVGRLVFGLIPDDWGSRLDDDWNLRATMGVGQHMYTPEEKSAVVPDPLDRPYAGWLYLSSSAFAYKENEIGGLELQLGVVGPDAHAGPLQNWFHRRIGAPPVNGWASELNNEFGVNLHGEWRRRYVLAGTDRWGADAFAIATAAFGNVEISGGAGTMIRLGYNLREDYGPPRLRPGAAGTEFFTGRGDRTSLYVFAGVYGRAVGRDIFLDGNTFSDSASVDRETWVPEYTWGAAWRTPNLYVGWGRYLAGPRISYTYVERGHEFAGQRGPSRFGAWSITFVRNGLEALW